VVAGFNVVLTTGMDVFGDVEDGEVTVVVETMTGAHNADTCPAILVDDGSEGVAPIGTVVVTDTGTVVINAEGAVVLAGEAPAIVVVDTHSGIAAFRVLSSVFPPHAETNKSTTKPIFILTSRCY
jgi:hypothetical protein